MKNFSKLCLVLFTMLLAILYHQPVHAQCTGCTVTNPVLSGNYTFAANSTVCFTSDATLGDVTFLNNSKICVAPGVTVTIQNNVTSTSGNNVTLEIGGTLQFTNPPVFNSNLTVNVESKGTLKSGSTGNGNFIFNGTTNNLTNIGTVQVSVLDFNNSSSTNIIDNYGTLTIGSNINIQGKTTFRNWNLINIGASYNNNATSTYINCGTINSSSGFNLGGGKVINTGDFNIGSGQIDLSGGTLENYGTLLSTGTINGTGASIFYNEGLAKITSFQPNGASIKGPLSNNKKGYFYVINQINHNGSKVGPNLDFKKYTSFSPDIVSGSQGESQIFSNTPTYVNSSGTTTTASLANVTYACSVCTAPLVTNIGVCPNIDGTFPPQANDDAFTIAAGSFSTTNVLANDFAVFNGAAATTSNVTITQVSTTNSGVNVNTSGIVSVAAGTLAGTYTIVYRICSISNPSSCDTATITVTVPLDSDGDGIPDSTDLDDDNDGITDVLESTSCISSEINWLHNADGGQTDAATYTPSGASVYYSGAANMLFGAGLDETTDNYPNTYMLRNATATTFAGAKADNDYAQVSFAPVQNMTLDSINFGYWTNNDTNVPDYYLGNYKLAVEYSTSSSFTSPVLLFSDVQVQNMILNGYLQIKNPLSNLILTTGNTYYFRIYLYDEQNTDEANRVRLDDIFFPGKIISTCDTDGDGQFNSNDLDSDGDGCPDAIEGDENVTSSQINANGSINIASTGGVDTNGIPNLVNNGGTADIGSDQGQGIGTSQNDAINVCVGIASDDINQTPAGTAVSGGLLTNDTNLTSITGASFNGSILTVNGTTANTLTIGGVTYGTIVVNINGTYTFTPASGYTGQVPPITYTAINTNGGTDQANLYINVVKDVVVGANNPPVANPDVATVKQGAS
ncbi:beta strand repeat-containing protein, partial [Macellibacteroides fermentans]|uniref:beta strand repeat-containing protein n=1 Tax=Macellibacteroides fermentans TaxID=879969 RepID=UPI00352C5E20